MTPTHDGLILLDKPRGPTSHDLVARVRRITGIRRVGHAGTLDPLATGLLPLVLGRATRLVRFLPKQPKHYEGTLRLGLTSSTDDIEGEIRARFDGALPPVGLVLATARMMQGRQAQVPPVYSAKKVDGMRLHRMARQGLEVLAAAVEVEIERFELEPTGIEGDYSFHAEVSSGTYIRALARDLGAALGCGGLLVGLRRTAIGPLSVARALGWPSAEPLPAREAILGVLIPLEAMPLDLPIQRLADDHDAARFARGNFIASTDPAGDGSIVRVLGAAGNLLGIAELRDGRIRPKVVLAG